MYSCGVVELWSCGDVYISSCCVVEWWIGGVVALLNRGYVYTWRCEVVVL